MQSTNLEVNKENDICYKDETLVVDINGTVVSTSISRKRESSNSTSNDNAILVLTKCLVTTKDKLPLVM